MRYYSYVNTALVKYKNLAVLFDLQKNKPTGFSLPSELIQRIDAERGDIPRSRFLLRILESSYLTPERKKEVAVTK